LNRVVIASKNKGKISEIINIVKIRNVIFTDLNELGFNEEIEEKGSTFLENALIKAEKIYKVYNIPVIADDSGLVVDYLNGEPGVYSARFAGEKATDEENNLFLLSKMKGVPFKKRSARFICISVFYYSAGKYFYSEGNIQGIITTMAQLSQIEKNKISHRATAFRKLKSYIEDSFIQ